MIPLRFKSTTRPMSPDVRVSTQQHNNVPWGTEGAYKTPRAARSWTPQQRSVLPPLPGPRQSRGRWWRDSAIRGTPLQRRDAQGVYGRPHGPGDALARTPTCNTTDADVPGHPPPTASDNAQNPQASSLTQVREGTETHNAPVDIQMASRTRMELRRQRRPWEGRRGWSAVAGPHLTFGGPTTPEGREGGV